jgi:hypothetical protein
VRPSCFVARHNGEREAENMVKMSKNYRRLLVGKTRGASAAN